MKNDDAKYQIGFTCDNCSYAYWISSNHENITTVCPKCETLHQLLYLEGEPSDEEWWTHTILCESCGKTYEDNIKAGTNEVVCIYCGTYSHLEDEELEHLGN